MFIKNFNLNSFLQGGFNILITMALGFAMIVCGAFMLFQYTDYRANVQKVEQLDIVSEGRVHIFDVPGRPVKCFILDSPGGVKMRTIGTDGSGLARCNDVQANVKSWESNVRTFNPSFFQIGLGVFITLVMFTAAIGYGLIPIMTLVWLTKSDWLYENMKILAFVIALPVLIYGSSFTFNMAVNPPATMWLHDGMPVKTHKVYVTRDGGAYRAPENMFDWPDAYVARRVTKLNF